MGKASAMIFSRGWVLCVLLTVGGFVQPLLAGVYGPDPCSICGQAITGTIYLGTDKTTGEKKMVCGTCVRLPDCIICSLPVGAGGIQLADGRHLCARDAKTVVLKASEVERISFQVRDELDRLFSRFAEFPKQVEVSAIDRIDVDDMFHPDGNDFESPNLLGCIKTEEVEGVKHFKMRVMTGLPLTELKATCAHELSHGVVAHTCNLEYHGEPGALNEHFADVFGVLTEQWSLGQTADKASWLVGAEILGPKAGIKAIRTFKGEKAFAGDPLFGTDPQPKHMKDFYNGEDDDGGVHINSGIPNHAFFLAASALGGKAWETVGPVWYKALSALDRQSGLKDAARTTWEIARRLYGPKSREAAAVKAGWKGVGLGV